MRIMCVSDYHRDLEIAERVEKLATKEKVDVIVNAGDFLSEEFATKVFASTSFITFVVHGNWDRHLKARSKRVKVLVNEVAEHKGYYFLGVEYGHYDEIEKLAKGKDPKKLIIITHDPPYDILDMSYFGSNAGMPELRDVIERLKPAMHVFGHIHESAGVVKHKGTLYVNAALPEFRKAAIVDLPSQKVAVFDV
ncbi:MAG: metallophosphoesterase family protein [Candidatus Aenigmarchaeota archaeon]|nr:metallophosphoesterase family protein [Candidatus Aenigmarchaeota archaeon]